MLAINIGHAGACHLYIHAVEPSEQPQRGEACADVLAEQMPGVSHIQHMPSHIYMRVGRYGDAVRSNQKAILVDQMAEHGRAVAVMAVHNIHMLSFAASMDGQGAIAILAARDLAKADPRKAFNYPIILARFGRWHEVLDLQEPDELFQQGIWAFARGLSRLRLQQRTDAERELARLATIYDKSFEIKNTLLRIAQNILAGEVAAAEGRFDEAIADLRAAVKLEDSLTYSEPELWLIPPRQVLGAILLQAGRIAEAEKVYLDDLRHHPENGWALFGLSESLKAQKRWDEAAAMSKRFDQAWARSDIFLTSSRL